MNLRQLKYFVSVVELGNMTRAAESLFVAQPALGMQIRQLEEELGVVLLVRHSRGVEPTSAGALLHARALAILKLVDETRQEVSAHDREGSEAVRLGLTPMLMMVIGPELVVRIRDCVPQVFLSLVEEMSHVLVDSLARGEIDLALAYDVPDLPHLARTELLREDLVLVSLPASGSGPLPASRSGRPIAFAEAMEESLALPESRDTVRDLVVRTAHELGLEPKIAFATGLMIWLSAQVPAKFGVIAVLFTVPCVCALFGALNGALIVYGRLQPFIVTLAMMVGALGLARLIAGQDTAVYPVYTGTNATESFEALRMLLWGVIPVPGLFFLSVLAIFYALTRFTTYGAYLLAIGGNEQASRLAGINVNRIKIATYTISSALAGLAGILYVAQFRQGKPDAGMGLELDAIAAVVIGGTSLMGGRGSVIGTMVGVLIFGFLGNILQLNNIDSNSQLVLKGAIIIAAVLLQEGQLGVIFSKLRKP